MPTLNRLFCASYRFGCKSP